MKKEVDRHLQAPQEANRDKHINFTAIEQGDEDPATENADNITQGRFKEKVVEKKANKKVEKKGDKKAAGVKGNAGLGSDDEAH
jgi:hypothetical protein